MLSQPLWKSGKVPSQPPACGKMKNPFEDSRSAPSPTAGDLERAESPFRTEN